MAVDVVVCTYNSERFLEPCLSSIQRNVPVRNLIIVDKYSKDKTVEIAKQHSAYVFFSNCGLAEARKKSFLLVGTELFVSVDSDVVLADNWFNRIMKFWQDDIDNNGKGHIGCIWGITVDQHPLHKAYLKAMWKLRDASGYNITHLPNMVARRDILEDFEYPKAFDNASVANEDIAIKRWIESKGFKCVNAPVFSSHYSYPTLIDHKTFWYGASARLGKLVSMKSIILRCVLSVPQAIYAGLASKNARVIPYWIKFRFQVMYGYLHPTKYYNLKRN